MPTPLVKTPKRKNTRTKFCRSSTTPKTPTPNLTPQRKRKALEDLNPQLEKTPKKNCQPTSQTRKPPPKQWLEFTSVEGKIILMKTVDKGQAKSTRKRKSKKSIPTPYTPTKPTPTPTPLESGKCRQNKLAMEIETYISPRKTYLKKQLTKKSKPQEEMEKVRSSLRPPPTNTSRPPPPSSCSSNRSSEKMFSSQVVTDTGKTPINSTNQGEKSEGCILGKENILENGTLKILINKFEKTEPYINISKPEERKNNQITAGGTARNLIVCKISKISSLRIQESADISATQPMGGIRKK